MTKPQAKRVIILGALSAIAIATARLYAREGARLCIAGRNRERLEDLGRDLMARGAAQVALADLDLETGGAEAARHLAAWRDELGGLDHILLAYGTLGAEKDARRDTSALLHILSINFTSAACWCSAGAALLADQGHGTLIALSSVAGDRGRQSNYAYGAAKGGLALFVQGLAHVLAGTGARAVVVKPGFVDTPMTAALPKSGPLWASPDTIAKVIRRAADRSGPIQYAPSFWRLIMLIIRLIPAGVFHRTRL
jgi:NAD(P)-dependent dehydrogenase (short-subunit alcohol dehydrogenase family)